MTPLWQNSGVMQRRGDHRTQIKIAFCPRASHGGRAGSGSQVRLCIHPHTRPASPAPRPGGRAYAGLTPIQISHPRG